MADSIHNGLDVIDSRDVVSRIESLERDVDGLDEDDRSELETLRAVAEQGENSPDWNYGETLIRDSYFASYIEELIYDCYPMPPELKSGEWPWRHISIDYEAAADEAKADYIDVDFDGVTYWIRA